MIPTIGRIVHVRIGTEEDGSPVLRPATVVRCWGGTTVNVQALVDGYNDEKHLLNLRGDAAECCERGLAWLTSISEGEGVGQWRWPAR